MTNKQIQAVQFVRDNKSSFSEMYRSFVDSLPDSDDDLEMHSLSPMQREWATRLVAIVAHAERDRL